MKTQTQHTPTTLRREEDELWLGDTLIATLSQEADTRLDSPGERIVHRYNCHADLLAALAYIIALTPQTPSTTGYHTVAIPAATFDAARAALAKAGE